MIAYAERRGISKSALAIEIDVSLKAYGTEAHLCCFLQCIIEQCLAIALAFIVGMNAYGAEGHDRVSVSSFLF